MSNYIKLTGLYRNTTKDGKPMLTGYLGKARIYILPNTQKGEDASKPHDYFIFIADAPPKNNSWSRASHASTQTPAENSEEEAF